MIQWYWFEIFQEFSRHFVKNLLKVNYCSEKKSLREHFHYYRILYWDMWVIQAALFNIAENLLPFVPCWTKEKNITYTRRARTKHYFYWKCNFIFLFLSFLPASVQPQAIACFTVGQASRRLWTQFWCWNYNPNWNFVMVSKKFVYCTIFSATKSETNADSNAKRNWNKRQLLITSINRISS